MRLTITAGPKQGRTVEITGDRFTVGRDEASDVVIQDPEVSRTHAYFKALPDGRAELYDLGSSNGTFVNGHRISSVTLSGGEEIRFGNVVLQASPSATDQPTPAGTPVVQPTPASTPSPPAPFQQPPAQVPQPPAPAFQPPPRLQQPSRSQSTIQRIILQRSVRRATVVGIVVGVLVVAVAVLFGTGVLPLDDDDEGGSANQVADVIDKLRPGVTLVVVDLGGGAGSRGTGWVYDAEEGLIVTNAHVVEGGQRFSIGQGEALEIQQEGSTFTAGRQSREAELIESAPCEDLAVLKVDETEGLQPVPLAPDQNDLRVGETVIAMGYPSNLAGQREASFTGTTGVVSVKETEAPAIPLQTGGQVGPYTNVVQTDAVVNQGNSGGPLVNLKGEVVGVNSAGRTDVGGQYFAVGVDRVRQVVPDLADGEDLC